MYIILEVHGLITRCRSRRLSLLHNHHSCVAPDHSIDHSAHRHIDSRFYRSHGICAAIQSKHDRCHRSVYCTKHVCRLFLSTQCCMVDIEHAAIRRVSSPIWPPLFWPAPADDNPLADHFCRTSNRIDGRDIRRFCHRNPAIVSDCKFLVRTVDAVHQNHRVCPPHRPRNLPWWMPLMHLCLSVRDNPNLFSILCAVRVWHWQLHGIHCIDKVLTSKIMIWSIGAIVFLATRHIVDIAQ